jgi:hypothetical protein
MEQQKCDICSKPIHAESLDLMISVTTYEENGDVVDTMIELGPTEVPEQYIVVCEGCQPGVIAAWNEMLYKLRS